MLPHARAAAGTAAKAAVCVLPAALLLCLAVVHHAVVLPGHVSRPVGPALPLRSTSTCIL